MYFYNQIIHINRGVLIVGYFLKDACICDKHFIYQTKKDSIKKYVELIWGWDEEYQIKSFEKDFFLLSNFKVIYSIDKKIGFLEINETDKLINITEIHINPEFQRRGIGSKIINEIIYEAKEKNKKIALGCFKKNHGAVKLYIKLGFKIIEETETHFVFEYNH